MSFNLNKQLHPTPAAPAAPTTPVPTEPPASPAEPAESANEMLPPTAVMSEIMRLLHVQRDAGIEFPKLRMLWAHDSGQNDDWLTVNLATERARIPGVGNVSRGPYGNSEWFGRIHPDGRFEPSRRVDTTKLHHVTERLTQFASSTIAELKLFGDVTCACCFCGRELTHPNSTAAGYGPICADRYGLPWGGAESTDQPTDKPASEPKLAPTTATFSVDELAATLEREPTAPAIPPRDTEADLAIIRGCIVEFLESDTMSITRAAASLHAKLFGHEGE